MATIQQHRCPAVGGRELEAARGGLVGGLDLRDHAGERAVAQGILGHRQHLGVLATLRVEDAIRAEAHLLESRGVEIEARERPQDVEAGRCCEPRRNPCCEQRRGGIIVQRCGCAGDFVETRPVQTLAGKAAIECFDPERQHGPALALGQRQLRTKRG